MGYRSQVAIALKKDDYESLKNLAEKENKDSVLDILKEGEEKQLPCPDKTHIILYWDWIKWYGNDIRFIEDFLSSLDDEEKEYEFVHLPGYNDGDSKQIGDGEYIWLDRSIGYIGE